MPAFQRDRVDDPRGWRREVARHRRVLADATGPERLRALGRLGDLLRAGRALDEAVGLLTEAVVLARCLDDEPAVRANEIRLATALMYRGERVRARDVLEALVARIEGSSDRSYLDFAVQHLGKVYAELERWEAAVECFSRACQLRREEPALLASSTRALHEAQSHGHPREVS